MALAMGTSSMALAQSGVGTAAQRTPASTGTVTVTTIAGGPKQEPAATEAPAATTTAPAAESATKRSSEEVAERTYRLSVGQEELVPAKGVKNIAVSNPKVVTASVVRNGEGVLVNAGGRGQSDVRVFTDDGVRLYRFIVSGANIEQDLDSIRELLVDISGVRVERSKDLIVTKGTLISKDDERRYKAIIERFDVVDLVDRKINDSEEKRSLAELQKKLVERNFATVKAALVTDPKGEVGVWLTGVVYTDQAKNETQDIAEMYFANKIVNHVSLEKRMVEVDVTMLTVDLNKSNGRGDNAWNSMQVGMGQTLGELSPTGEPQDATSGDVIFGTEDTGNSPFDSNGLFGSTDQTDWSDANLDFRVLNGVQNLAFLKSKTYTTYYGEQHQAVLSKETADFQDGATIFVPLVGSENAGLATIETGLSVSVTPEILENTKIRTEVAIDLLAQNQSQAPKFEDAGGGTGGASAQTSMQLKKFKSSSTLDCENGQTIVVSGINSNLFGMTKDSTPLLEQIPVVNLLFKKHGRNGQNIRSFLFVTPELPKTFEEAGRRAYSSSGPEAKTYYKGDSLYREGNWAYYLGWAKDVPAPPEPTPFPEDGASKKDWIDKIEF